MRVARILWTLVALSLVAVAVYGVDLAPRVEEDFFFAPDDPQLQASARISADFPSPAQVLVRVAAPDPTSNAYRERIADLTSDLESVPGVAAVSSVTTERAERSPLWSRLLLPPGGEATNLVLTTPEPDGSTLVPALEGALGRAQAPDFEPVMSGVPVIVEWIRRSLARDLRVFSLAALLTFGTLVGLIYRDARVLAGMLLTSAIACASTLIIDQAIGLSIGLLTANIVTIVFVLTLSHMVFLTANARQMGAARAVGATMPASFWAMVTTLLGFLSLTLASARPLRELGWAGAVGTLVALGAAYLVYPAFLPGGEGAPSPGEPVTDGSSPEEGPSRGSDPWRSDRQGPRRDERADPAPSARATRAAGAFLVAVGLLGLGVPRLTTDPGLLGYFAPASELREGLEQIDRDGGSSTLDIVVRAADGGRLDRGEANDAMWAFQDSLEAIPEVGVVVSPPVLFGHARTQPLAGLLPLSLLADILESDLAQGVGRSFLTADRERGRYHARMHEADRTRPRSEVIAQIERAARASGLETERVGGVYDLQRALGDLIAGSLRVGLGGLLVLFVGIGMVVSRSVRVTAWMLVGLIGIPLVVLGGFGLAGIPVDMITSPAANVALALGVDAMIHLTIRARLEGSWVRARRQLAQPILAGALIVSVGFGIFVLSAFPPTARFGLAVVLGTLTAAVMALGVLPTLAMRSARRT